MLPVQAAIGCVSSHFAENLSNKLKGRTPYYKQPPFSPIRSGPKAASTPSRQKQIPSSEVEILRGQVVALNELMTQKNAEIESQRLLIETIEAERDSRLTLEEVQDARAGSVVLASDEGGAVKLKFQLEKSADLRVWERMDVAIETEFSLPEGRKFLRFSMSE